MDTGHSVWKGKKTKNIISIRKIPSNEKLISNEAARDSKTTSMKVTLPVTWYTSGNDAGTEKHKDLRTLQEADTRI